MNEPFDFDPKIFRTASAESSDTSSQTAMLKAWKMRMTGVDGEPKGRLPSHSETCAGCGKSNRSALGLEVYTTDFGVSAVHRFDERQEGAPGITHGGLIATAFDDLFGFLLYRVGEPAVTRSLTVEYMSPVLLGVDYYFSAQVKEQHGRRLYVDALAVDDEDRTGCVLPGDVCHCRHGSFRTGCRRLTFKGP